MATTPRFAPLATPSLVRSTGGGSTDRFLIEDFILYIGDRPIIWALVELGCQIGVDGHIRKASIPVETGYVMTLDWGDASHSDNYERWKSRYPFEDAPLTVEMFIMNRKGLPVTWCSWATVPTVTEILDDLIASGRLPDNRIGITSLR